VETSHWPSEDGVVEFPDGRRVRGRGLREPDFGIYLLAKSPPATAWRSAWIRWPDFRLPADERSAFATLTEAFERSADERVEIACRGGHGRTGCALAVLAVLSGIDPADAVEWVRVSYHRRAVETPWQRLWVARLNADKIHSAR
jgi:Protein-tyrosine phosphatase